MTNHDLIEKCGGVGMAEIIVSLVTTRAILPNCYLPELKVYGHACDYSKALFVFDEESNQFLPYKPLDEAECEIVMLDQLKAELEVSKGLGVCCEY